MHIIHNQFAKSHHTLFLENDLRVRVIVMSPDSPNGLTTVDFTLVARKEAYGLTLIPNPLLDYNSARERLQKISDERDMFLREHSATDQIAKMLQKDIVGTCSVIHWYQVDEYADRMTVGMSVAVWAGLNRTHTITLA